MDNTTIALLAGLLGSIFTVVAQKVLELFQDNKNHKYHLQKNYFDKKLAAAEKAAGQFTLMSTSFSNLSTLYSRIPETNNDNEVEIELNKYLFESGQAFLQKASDSSYELANTIFLYFDLDESKFWDTEPIRAFYNKLSELEILNKKLNSFYGYLNTVQGTEHEEFALQQIENVQIQIKDCYRNMAEIFKGAQVIYLDMLSQMRLEMQKFEP